MAHRRKRHALALLKRKLAHAPIVAIQGARQVGKSFFAREWIAAAIRGSGYVTLDLKGQRDAAIDAPTVFLERLGLEHTTLIIDEVQKAPDLFDALKYAVDQERRPGRFVILGSTEFSKMHRIRESLTGRLARLRLYPFTIAEALGLDASEGSGWYRTQPRVERKQVLRHIEAGGLPGICFLRSRAERHSAIEDLLQLIAFRDTESITGSDPSLIIELLGKVATLELPTLGNLARAVRRDPRRVRRQLDILCELFVLTRLTPHPLGKGKPVYYLYDSAVARHLGADDRVATRTWVLQELSAQLALRIETTAPVQCYQTMRGSMIPFVFKRGDRWVAVQVALEETIKLTQLELLIAFGKRLAPEPVELCLLAPVARAYTERGVKILPLESLA